MGLLLGCRADADDGDGLAEGTGRLSGRGAPDSGPVSLHCCHSHARPSRMGLRGAGGGGSVVVGRRDFGVTTTWLSKAVVGPKPCSLSKAASNASLLFPYSVLRDIGALVASETIPVILVC